MKISFNPSNSNKNILDLIKNNKDIIFDLKGHSIFARGVEFKGTDTNTWRDIKINNVSIGSHTLDLRNGSNTTLTNTNGVVTINSTWRPVVDNLTSDSTTSSLSAKQGKVLKALIDGKSNSDHNHDDRYLKLTGGTMAGNALITFADSGSWSTDKGPQGARGGLYWTGQSDYAKLYAEETAGDNLDLVIQFGDDNSNGLSIRNKVNTQTSYISAGGVITTGTFKGNLDWSYITNKPSSYTPSAHTHTVFKNNLMIKGTNGISDSASIHLGIGDSDTGFKWISDGVCQIYANNAAVGQWTSGGMNWFKNPTVNGNKVWNAGNDGSGSGLDADTLDGEHASSFVRAGHYESQDLNKLDTYSFIRSVYSNVSSTSPKGNTGWYNVIQLVHRNGAGDGPSYIGQIALGMTTNTNDMFFRGKRTDPWKTVIHSGNIGNQTVANAYHLRINSANTWSTWYWAGQSGQPSWLWGSNDGTNMYVWDPSNFRVAYASSAGNADTVDGYHAASFVKMYTGKFNQYNEGTWTKILQFTIPSGDLQPTISFIWHPTECARDVWADFNINIRSGSPIFYVNWKGTTRRTVYCVGDGTTYSVWVQGTKSRYDPFGLVQVISTWQINTYQAGSLQYSDSEPTGTYKVVASMSGIIMYADRLLTARKINGTSFDGTSDITTAYWGTTRTISLTGAITGSVSTNGGGNITINTTYGTGNITNLDNRYVKKAGDTMQGNLTFTSGKQTRWTAQGTSYITDGNVDSGTSLGGDLANLVISSWYGVSFTTSCSGQTYTNKTAVGINCRTGQLYAREVQANGFMHTGHNNNDAVLLAGGGYKTLKDFIFLNKSYNYTDHEHYNLAFHKLSGICNNLVWVDGHVKGSIAKFFVIDPAVFPYRYDEDPNLNTIYLMSGNNYITINAIGIVTINNATDHEQRVGFFYTGRA